VKLYAESASQAAMGFDVVEAEVHRLDMKYSHYREDSYLARIQIRAAQTGGTVVDEETAALLKYAETQFRISDGMLDITTRCLSTLWDHALSVPEESQIKAALQKTGWRRVELNGCRLRIPPGMEFDLGGIVKEYAADRSAGLLKKAGFQSGYVDLGGDLYFLGPHPDGRPWRAGIRNPESRTRPVATVEVSTGGLASSGNYERYKEFDGVRYCHIVNPRTGWPVSSDSGGMTAVSVLAPSCLLAGSVSTLAMLLSRKKAIQFLEQSGLQWFAIPSYVTGQTPAVRRMLKTLANPGFPDNALKTGFQTKVIY